MNNHGILYYECDLVLKDGPFANYHVKINADMEAVDIVIKVNERVQIMNGKYVVHLEPSGRLTITGNEGLMKVPWSEGVEKIERPKDANAIDFSKALKPLL